jgi:hypothetical protein
MEPNDKILEIDQYSIFDLMGLGEMSSSQQQNMLLDINELVWTNFLGERLTYIFTSDQIQSIKDKIDNGEKTPALLGYLNQLSPNFNELLTEYTRFFKIDFIRKHYHETIADLDKIILETENADVKKKLESDRAKNVRALECINTFQWEEVLKIFYPEDYEEQN